MSCGNKLIYIYIYITCISVDRLLLHYYILELLLGEKKIIVVPLWKLEREEIVCLHSEATARNMHSHGAGSAN